MIRRLSVFLLVTLAIVSGVAVVSQAQPQSLLTRHTRDVVVSGQAPLIGRLPATQSLRIVLVLPHRNQAELENLLRRVWPQPRGLRLRDSLRGGEWLESGWYLSQSHEPGCQGLSDEH